MAKSPPLLIITISTNWQEDNPFKSLFDILWPRRIFWNGIRFCKAKSSTSRFRMACCRMHRKMHLWLFWSTQRKFFGVPMQSSASRRIASTEQHWSGPSCSWASMLLRRIASWCWTPTRTSCRWSTESIENSQRKSPTHPLLYSTFFSPFFSLSYSRTRNCNDELMRQRAVVIGAT